jgi:hypothetical protein
MLAAGILALFCATAGHAQQPKGPRPSPTPAPTATPVPTPKPTATPTAGVCPLPDNYTGVTGATVTQEKPYEAVCHNGKILCCTRSAAKAHIKHGDTDLGPCNKPGTDGNCTP